MGRAVRSAVLVALSVGLVVAGVAGWLMYTEERDGDSTAAEPATVVGEADDGWRRLDYADIRLEAPGAWARLDTSECDLVTEHWGPPTVDPCANGAGLWFYGSATYDSLDDPGVHKVPVGDVLLDGGWGGYVIEGATVVYVQDVDQEVARRVLRSVGTGFARAAPEPSGQ